MDNTHYAVIDPYRRRLRVEYQGRVVAETDRALILKEVGRSVYDPVLYVPREDIAVDLRRLDEPSGSCPIKGQSSRWNLAEGPTDAYFGWSYEEPLPGVEAIKGHIAFNLRYVTLVSAPLT